MDGPMVGEKTNISPLVKRTRHLERNAGECVQTLSAFTPLLWSNMLNVVQDPTEANPAGGSLLLPQAAAVGSSWCWS